MVGSILPKSISSNCLRIGVLALQGAFIKHQEILDKIGVSSIQIRNPTDLQSCCGLIIPGGESTAISFHIKERQLLSPLINFAQQRPIFGTCAGMIVMAKSGILSLLEITVARNAYGRQNNSFLTNLKLSFSPLPQKAFFIRAPIITALNSPQVLVLAEHEGNPVFVQQGIHLAASFHPELTNDLQIHKYFVTQCAQKAAVFN